MGPYFLRRFPLHVVILRSAATKDLRLPFGLFPDHPPWDRIPTPPSPARCHPEERSDEGSAVAFRVISGSPTMGPYSYAAFSCALSSRGAQRRRICGCLSGYFRIGNHGTEFPTRPGARSQLR